MGGEGNHAVFAAPVELTTATPQQPRARLMLERRVALCSPLLERLGLPKDQKNWAPFAYKGKDYVVYSLLPLRIFRVGDYGNVERSGACEEVDNAHSPDRLETRLDECNNAVKSQPTLNMQSIAWRKCTGASMALPRGPSGRANEEERRLVRDFSLHLGGGTPGIVLAGTGDGVRRPHELGGPAGAVLGGGTDDVILFAAHSKLHASSSALLDRLLSSFYSSSSPRNASATAADGVDAIGPERGWHSSYEKLYHMFWFAIKPSGSSEFELVSLSRFFTPPNTRWATSKIVYPTGLLLHPNHHHRHNNHQSTCSSPLRCARTTRLHLSYGELDVLSHAWSPTLAEVLRSMVPASALFDSSKAGEEDRTVVPFLLRAVEATQRRMRSGALPNDLSAPFYAAAPPLGGGSGSPSNKAAAAAAKDDAAELSCRGHGFTLMWNGALHPFAGAPAAVSRDDGRSRECSAAALTSERVGSALECCALCAATSDACAAWTYFAPYCYWSLGCDKSLSDRATMWGAIAGMRSL